MDLLLISIGVVLTIGTGLFVASEFALVNLDRADLEARQARGETRLNLTIRALKITSTHLSSAQLGITLTTLLTGYTMEPAISKLRDLAAKVDPDASVDGLVRSGQATLATELVEAETHASNVRKAHDLVALLDKERSLKNGRVLFADYELAKRVIDHGAVFSVRSLLAAIKAGGDPILPTRDELRGISAAIEADAEEARAKSAGRFGDRPNWFAPVE